jgi:hypothetical protein
VQDRHHKRLLFDFLSGRAAKSPARSVTSLSPARDPVPDLTLRGANCQINLALSFTGRPVTRRNNENRFSSPGVTGQRIFREEPDPPSRAAAPSADNSLAKFFVRKLMLPQAAPRFLEVADANFELLQELSHWVEQRNTNPFPVDALLTHPTLSPYQESAMNNRKNWEDHLERVAIPPLPHTVASGSMPQRFPWKTPSTAYTSFFENEERFRRSYLSGPYPPIEQSRPFSRFPRGKQGTAEAVDSVFAQQSKEDTMTGRRYKHIFESSTVL